MPWPNRRTDSHTTFCTWRSCKRTHVVIETTRQFLMRFGVSWNVMSRGLLVGCGDKTCDLLKSLYIYMLFVCVDFFGRHSAKIPSSYWKQNVVYRNIHMWIYKNIAIPAVYIYIYNVLNHINMYVAGNNVSAFWCIRITEQHINIGLRIPIPKRNH